MFACLIVLALTGCGSSPTPPPTVMPVPPTAPVQSAPTATAQPGTTTNTMTLAPFTIKLPAAVPLFYPATDAWQPALAQLAQQQPQLATYLTTLATITTDEPTVALARPADALILIAATLPADGLTLQSYLAAAQRELAQSRLTLGSGIVVQNAAIRYDLHEAHIPLATIQYTLPAQGDNANDAIAGYQAAMLDPRGKQLLLLTFLTQPAQQAAAQELITTILARLQATTIDQ